MYITVFLAKSSRNKRNYDLVPVINNAGKNIAAGSIKTNIQHNVTPKKMKEFLLTEGYKQVIKRLKKTEKDDLTSCRYIRDILSNLNSLAQKYKKEVYFLTLPQGSLLSGM